MCFITGNSTGSSARSGLSLALVSAVLDETRDNDSNISLGLLCLKSNPPTAKESDGTLEEEDCKTTDSALEVRVRFGDGVETDVDLTVSGSSERIGDDGVDLEIAFGWGSLIETVEAGCAREENTSKLEEGVDGIELGLEDPELDDVRSDIWDGDVRSEGTGVIGTSISETSEWCETSDAEMEPHSLEAPDTSVAMFKLTQTPNNKRPKEEKRREVR
jgi:hypothetical protein